jgi:hypothetical protein
MRHRIDARRAGPRCGKQIEEAEPAVRTAFAKLIGVSIPKPGAKPLYFDGAKAVKVTVIGKAFDDASHWTNANHSARQAHVQMKSVQEHDRVPLGREVPALPGREERFQPPDDAQHGPFRQMRRAQQRLERRLDPARVHAAQITARDGIIDLAGPPGVPRQQLAVKLLGRRQRALDVPWR